jgi:hypothetical protein
MRVAAEIVEDVPTLREGGFGVDVPRDLRNRAREPRKGFGIFEVREAREVALAVKATKLGEHLGTKHLAHRLDGKEERAVRSIPACTVEAEAPAGDNGVDMRMELELARPGMQHEGGADGGGQTRAREAGKGPRCRTKESAEYNAASEAREGPKLCRESEDDVKMRHIEHASSLHLDPLLLGQGLALGTVPIATRVVRGVLVAAREALIEVPTEHGSTAPLDVGQDAALARAKPDDRFELRPVGTNDVRKVEASVGCPSGSHPSAWQEVEQAWCFANALLRHTRIPGGCLDALVPDQLANDVDVGPFIEQVRGERVP